LSRKKSKKENENPFLISIIKINKKLKIKKPKKNLKINNPKKNIK